MSQPRRLLIMTRRPAPERDRPSLVSPLLLTPWGEPGPDGLQHRHPGADDRSMTATRARSLPDCRPLLADPDDLTLVFQPIVDLAAARIVG